MRSIVFEDNSNSLRYWIYTLIITTYCMNKRRFYCALLRATVHTVFLQFFSSSPSSILLFSLLHITQAPHAFFPLSLVPHQVLNHWPFAYLSLIGLSSTPLHYQVQLRITPPKIIVILLDWFVIPKNLHYNLLIHVLNICCTLHENMHRMWGSLLNKRG